MQRRINVPSEVKPPVGGCAGITNARRVSMEREGGAHPPLEAQRADPRRPPSRCWEVARRSRRAAPR